MRPQLGTWAATQECAWLGMETATFWFASWHSIHWATAAEANPKILMEIQGTQSSQIFFFFFFFFFVTGSFSHCRTTKVHSQLWVPSVSPDHVDRHLAAASPASLQFLSVHHLTRLVVLIDCFFNSLVVWVPCSLIFWQFWLFIDLRLIVILLVVPGSEGFPPRPPSWPALWSVFYWLCYYTFLFFLPFIPHPRAFPPPLGSCPWFIHISALASPFHILFLPPPVYFIPAIYAS